MEHRKITNPKHQITDKFRIAILNDQNEQNRFGHFAILVIVICLISVICYLEFLVTPILQKGRFTLALDRWS